MPELKPREKGLLFLLFLTEFARGAFFFTLFPIWVVDYLGFSVTVAGFALSAHYLTETLFKTIAGWEFDRLGRPVLAGGLILSFLSLLLIKMWAHPAVLIIFAALFGLGFSPLWLGVISRVAPTGISGRATRISMVFISWLAGTGGGMICVNFFMNKNYLTAFWLVIITWALSLLVAWFSTGENARPQETGKIKNTGHIEVYKVLRYMATHKITTRILLPGMFLQTLVAGILLPILKLFAQSQLHLNHNQYAMLLLAGGLSTVVFLLPMGYLVDRINLKLFLGAGFGFSSLILGSLAYTSAAKTAFFLAASLGFAYAMVLPAWNSLLAKIIPPENQATGWGVFATIEGFGVATGTALGSLIAKFFGIPATLLTTTFVLFIAAVFYIFCPIEKIVTEI